MLADSSHAYTGQVSDWAFAGEDRAHGVQTVWSRCCCATDSSDYITARRMGMFYSCQIRYFKLILRRSVWTWVREPELCLSFFVEGEMNFFPCSFSRWCLDTMKYMLEYRKLCLPQGMCTSFSSIHNFVWSDIGMSFVTWTDERGGALYRLHCGRHWAMSRGNVEDAWGAAWNALQSDI